jgi:hypothetical protein
MRYFILSQMDVKMDEAETIYVQVVNINHINCIAGTIFTIDIFELQTVTIVQSNIAIITTLETVDWSQNNNEIFITVTGNGNYEYSVDGFDYQDSNQFTNLDAGKFLVYVRDKNSCGVETQEVYLMYYPLFFTPNNDGYTNSWQLIASKKGPYNIIYIYDKYGKLLKQLVLQILVGVVLLMEIHYQLVTIGFY